MGADLGARKLVLRAVCTALPKLRAGCALATHSRRTFCPQKWPLLRCSADLWTGGEIGAD